MKISILTLFPNMFNNFVSESIIKRAIAKNLVDIEIINIRDFSKLNNKQVDDTPYGGGVGMVMMVEPIVDAINSIKTKDSHIILMGPCGKTFNQKKAFSLKKYKHLIFICGHYEGIDDRIKYYIDEEISIGDYILTGGELPSMVISDAVIRLLDGVIKKESYMEDTFSTDLVDYPKYTKPAVYDNHQVPDILLSGHHQNIEKWRREKQIEYTNAKLNDK